MHRGKEGNRMNGNDCGTTRIFLARMAHSLRLKS